MPTPKRYFQENSYYHVYNRGNRKDSIFLERHDYIRFLDKTKKYKEETSVQISCYCLMPNHFHFLIRQQNANQIQKFMHRLSTSYSKYFNIKYEQVGSLLQDRFKAKHIDKDEYLLYLTAYIHLNPAGREQDYEDLIRYPWSSLPLFTTDLINDLCNPEEILAMISEIDSKKKYQMFIAEQMKSKNFGKIDHLLIDPAG